MKLRAVGFTELEFSQMVCHLLFLGIRRFHLTSNVVQLCWECKRER